MQCFWALICRGNKSYGATAAEGFRALCLQGLINETERDLDVMPDNNFMEMRMLKTATGEDAAQGKNFEETTYAEVTWRLIPFLFL